jgi:poly-gamma-glutamate synthase PgsB/CapB
MTLLLYCSVALAVLGLVENAVHAWRLRRIPIRIHVNGTRGKSTTTRLIAAGLRENGVRVIAKTTGTAARLILEDGSEQPVRRMGSPNISEQLRLARLAASRKAEALVVECMALHPETQWVSQHRIIRATVGVITNVRDDHLDVMGPSLADAASALCRTIPRKGDLVTAEGRWLSTIEARARELRTKVHVVAEADVSDTENAAFPYVSFKENVACALKVCELLGVEKSVALRGMWRAMPDPGAMRVYSLTRDGRPFMLVDAFAANDPTSTAQIWELFAAEIRSRRYPVVALINSRADRPQRVAELTAAVADTIKPDYVVLVGGSSIMARRLLERRGVPRGRISDFSRKRNPETLLGAISETVQDGAVIFGMGNTKVMGQRVTEYFAANGAAKA